MLVKLPRKIVKLTLKTNLNKWQPQLTGLTQQVSTLSNWVQSVLSTPAEAQVCYPSGRDNHVSNHDLLLGNLMSAGEFLLQCGPVTLWPLSFSSDLAKIHYVLGLLMEVGRSCDLRVNEIFRVNLSTLSTWDFETNLSLILTNPQR